MAFAGAVFTEWYWGPLLFALLYGPVFAGVALVADLVISRWVRRLSWSERAALWGGVFVAGTLALVAGRAVTDHIRFERDAKAAAQKLDFAPYTAERLPDAFHEELVRVDRFVAGPVLIARYDTGPGAPAFAYQQRPPAELSLRDGFCTLHPLAGSSTNFFRGPCRELRTPRRLAVYLGTAEPPLVGGEAFALLDGTLVRLQHDQLADRDVLAYFDALRPVAPDDLDFEQG
jgi:hypothetical protein